MKFNLQHTIFFAVAFAMLVLSPQTLRAQESDLVPREYAPTANDIDESTYEASAFPSSENDKSVRTNAGYVLKDSVSSKSSASSRHAKKSSSSENQKANIESQKSVEKNKEEKEKNDSVLSFNFLYYIFQKFKMSDIVDR